MKVEYKSKKSNSVYTVTGESDRGFLAVSGDASLNKKVQAEIVRMRRSPCDFATAEWTARMLANTY